MASFRVGLVILVVAFAAMALVARSSENAVDMGALSYEADGHGLVADALDMDDEMMMESESARRQLGRGGYISYGALRRNKVPCNNRGQSYYNCRQHQQARPYRRGCTRATMCARNNR
ncbi:hypothetical protein ACJIZ3_007113 [Penstemon smallii]|uniref:Uncharacterized protein n=1 Tax=Penstemon smallii TaxID=265156 RepID=A0ABD3S9W3_9LAMI